MQTWRRPSPPRDGWLRLALFCTLLGAALTAIYAWVLARQAGSIPLDASGFNGYHHVLVPLLALLAVAGALMLERAAAFGMLLMLASTALALPGGAVWLLPGLAIACIWSVRQSTTARIALGFLLLLPGVASVFYGIFAILSFLTRVPLGLLPPSLSPPATAAQALAPLVLLPVALLGAWLLLTRTPPAARS